MKRRCEMNILLVSVKSQKSLGGIATWTDRLLSKCEQHGMSCELVNTEMQGKRATNETSKRNIIDEISRTLRIFKELNAALKKGGYDAAHLNTSCGTFGLFRDYIVAKQIKRKNVKLVTHFHCDIPYWIHNPISRRYLGKLVKLSDERLVLCENSRRYLETNYSIISTKVPNFINEEHILPEPKKVKEKLETVVFVGRVSVAKGAKELYEVARKIPDVTFRLVGNVTSDMKEVAPPKNVELMGGLPHEKVLEELDRADAFFFPTHSEGFSLALTEAMARGLPSVATDVGANADMLGGGCGIVTDIGDVDAMAQAIEDLYDASVRKQMSQNALNKVKEQYTADVIIESFKNYY